MFVTSVLLSQLDCLTYWPVFSPVTSDRTWSSTLWMNSLCMTATFFWHRPPEDGGSLWSFPVPGAERGIPWRCGLADHTWSNGSSWPHHHCPGRLCNLFSGCPWPLPSVVWQLLNDHGSKHHLNFLCLKLLYQDMHFWFTVIGSWVGTTYLFQIFRFILLGITFHSKARPFQHASTEFQLFQSSLKERNNSGSFKK